MDIIGTLAKWSKVEARIERERANDRQISRYIVRYNTDARSLHRMEKKKRNARRLSLYIMEEETKTKSQSV